MMIFVTPAAGARVRMPEKNSVVMPKKGSWVPRSVHYEGLLSSGDVVMADPQPPLPKASAVQSAAAFAENPVKDPTARTSAKEK